jgi:hypothetical protein
MSKYQAQTFSPVAQGQTALKAKKQTDRWMHSQGKLCWKCQKSSIPEKGCELSFQTGMHRYVCKGCIDARKAKHDGHGTTEVS